MRSKWRSLERASLTKFTITKVFAPSSRDALDQIADVDSRVIRRVNADLVKHIRHYGQWTDDASTKSAVQASIESLVGAS